MSAPSEEARELRLANADIAYVCMVLAEAYHKAVGCTEHHTVCPACDAIDTVRSWNIEPRPTQ